MSLTNLLQTGRLKRHSTSARELGDLLNLAQQGLADARVEAISLDLRFDAAYQAALQLPTIPLHCAGCRSAGPGHHATVFEALPLVMGDEFRPLSVYYNSCRVKRNIARYHRPGKIMQGEVAELICAVESFTGQVQEWLEANHPQSVRE